MELIGFLRSHWFSIAVSLVSVYTIWVGIGVMETIAEVKNRPREPMFWCHKHGHFRRKHVLPIPGMTDVCPMCYREAWDKAEQGLKRG